MLSNFKLRDKFRVSKEEIKFLRKPIFGFGDFVAWKRFQTTQFHGVAGINFKVSIILISLTLCNSNILQVTSFVKHFYTIMNC